MELKEISFFDKERLHKVLFERHTPIGRLFETTLLIAIIASIILVTLESVKGFSGRCALLFDLLEWTFTILFTIEYGLRLYCAHNPIRYATSFFGIIDLVSILPTYIAAFVVGAHTFLIIRVLRVFRVFRLFKLIKYMRAGTTITRALEASREKITVFLIFVLLMVTIIGSLMYMIEGGEDSGFTSIPRSIYWAIVTLTTVGYGDIAPSTPFGQFLAAAVMILGYAVLAVPTGIVSAEMVLENRKAASENTNCSRCGKEGHEENSRYCNRCGEPMVKMV